jgi:hypothetical protein
MRERIARRVKARYGEHRAIKVGTHSGQMAWVRPMKDRGSFDLIEGAYVQIRFGRGYGDEWQGELKIWKATDDRLFLEWV